MTGKSFIILLVALVSIIQPTLAAVSLPVSNFASGKPYYNIANHVNLPQDLINSGATTSTVRFNAVKHKSGDSYFRNIRTAYTNARYSENIEAASAHDFYVESSILYNNVIYPATFGGSSNVLLSKSWGRDVSDVIPGLIIPPNAEFYSFTKTIVIDQPSASIDIVTVTNANPGVVTYSGNDPTEGDLRRFSSVGGMTQLNYSTNGNISYKIKNLNTSAKTFELNTTANANVNTTAYTPYTSGGISERVYTYYGTTLGSTMTQDGAFGGKDPSVLMSSIARGAKVLQVIDPSKIVGGVLTTSTSTILKDPANLGQGYSGGLNVQFFYGLAGAGNLGAIHAGRSATANGNTSGGVLSSITVSAGGNGYDVGNLPKIFVGGTGSIATGWGSSTSTFGPIAVMGQADKPINNILLMGDSYNASGANFPDGTGTPDEYLMMQQGTVQRMAMNGNSAFQWGTHNTHQLELLDMLMSKGMRYTHAFNAYGVNDFGQNNSLTAVRNAMNDVNNTLRGLGIPKIIMKQVEPSTTSTDEWTTLAGQSPRVIGGTTNAYGAGGYVEQYNASLLSSNTSPIAYDYLVSNAAVVRDPIEPWKFNVDLFKNTINGTISTVTQTSPPSVTSTNHRLLTGQYIEITDGQTMSDLTGNRYYVTFVDANTFTLKTTAQGTVDATAYPAFSGTGTWTRVGGASFDMTHLTAMARQAVINAGYGFVLD